MTCCDKCCCNDNKKTKKINKFNKDSKIIQVLESNPKLKIILEGFGLYCFGCPMSQMETLEEASEAHGIDLDFMLEKLNSNNK